MRRWTGDSVATTVTQAFAQFRSNLEITENQGVLVALRQINVRDAVAANFVVQDRFLTGSYRRNTMIAPLSQADVDIFIVLDPRYYEAGGQARLLDSVKSALKTCYPNTSSISRNGQAVTLSFSEFSVDVVPSFESNGGYLIPDTYGKCWIHTNPKRHIEMSSELNQNRKQMLVPMVKMAKQWNRNISVPFRSFHLEVVMWEIVRGGEFAFLSALLPGDYPHAMCHFFDKGRAHIALRNPDPAGTGTDVGAYLQGSNLVNAKSAFSTAYNRASRAVSLAERGDHAAAIAEWQKVFGSSRFPSYG